MNGWIEVTMAHTGAKETITVGAITKIAEIPAAVSAAKVAILEATVPVAATPFSAGRDGADIAEELVAWKNGKSTVEYFDGQHTLSYPVLEDYTTIRGLVFEQTVTKAALA